MEYYASRVHLTNGDIATESGPIAAGTVGLTINRCMAGGVHEDLDLSNHGPTRCGSIWRS